MNVQQLMDELIKLPRDTEVYVMQHDEHDPMDTVSVPLTQIHSRITPKKVMLG